MSTIDPGGDRRDWETEWERLQGQVHDSPSETLPELDALVEEMMRARGYATEEALTQSVEPEVVSEFLAARDITGRVERGEDVDPSDVGVAVFGYQNLYEYLLEYGPPAGR